MNTAVPPKSLKAHSLDLPEHRDAFYGGKWHKPKSGQHADAINPGTANRSGRSLIAARPISTPRSSAAKAAFPAWRDTPPLERARLLKRIEMYCASTPRNSL